MTVGGTVGHAGLLAVDGFAVEALGAASTLLDEGEAGCVLANDLIDAGDTAASQVGFPIDALFAELGAFRAELR